MKRTNTLLFSTALSCLIGAAHGQSVAMFAALASIVIIPSANAVEETGGTGQQQCKEGDEVCQAFWDDPKKWKKVTADHMKADWESKLQSLQNQAKIEVYGPASWGAVSEDQLEKAFADIAALPLLKHMIVDPNYGRKKTDQVVLPSHISTLLSQADKLETLSVHDLDIDNSADLDQLALAFSKCTSLRELQIIPAVIGYKDVESLHPLALALAKLPNLTRIHLALDAFGDEEQTEKFANEVLPVLRSAPHLSDIALSQKEEGSYKKGSRELKYRILSNWNN